ncbi:MAG: MFS transporter [Planctomycetes bacterium]|nr:MFS transporter [Planctomycetota bacterium]
MPSFMLRALKYRNYRLFFAGQGVSLVGSWLSMVATQWLIYRLAPTATAAKILGFASFAAQIPVLFVGPLGGVASDRWDNRRMLLATQFLSMAQSAALAGLAFSDLATIPLVVGLSFMQGFVNAFDMPARQTFVVRIIEDSADLPNAIAINSTMFNGARLVGPAIAGVIIARAGVSYCFLIDAVSFLAVIGALLAIRMPPTLPRGSRTTLFFDFKQGLRYSWKFLPVRAAILMGAAGSLAYMSLMVIVPLFADKLAGGEAPVAGGEDPGARIYGFLTAATGCGALASGLFLASRKTVRGLGRLIAVAPLLMAAGIFCFAESDHLAAAMASMFLTGLGMLLLFASLNTVLQTIIDDDKRGRVMSLFTISFMGVAPFGSLLGGAMAQQFGEVHAAMLSGCIPIAAAAVFYLRLPSLRAIVRPIYERKGIGKDIQ